jgi:hypothetical protein
MHASVHNRLVIGLCLAAIATVTACADSATQNVRVAEPLQCKTGEQYICIGKSASRLKTDNDTDHEICRCARLNELPQMGPGRP